MSQSAGRSPVLLAGLVILFTVALGLAAFGLNRVVNPPPPVAVAPPCPAAPNGHPAINATHSYTQGPPMSLQPGTAYTAVMCTNRGVIKVSLRSADAPQTVNAFVFLVNHGYYDGLTFHRVCPNPADRSCGGATSTIKIAQGGDPKGDGSGRFPGFTIPDEVPTGVYTAGTVALARPSNRDGSKLPNSSGGQFFINTGDNRFQPDYNLFGDVTAGLSVAQRLVKGDRIVWIAIQTGVLESPSPGASPAPAATGSPSPAVSGSSPSP